MCLVLLSNAEVEVPLYLHLNKILHLSKPLCKLKWIYRILLRLRHRSLQNLSFKL